MTEDRREARAEAIRVERARRKLNQGQVARLAGLDQSTVSLAESGRGSVAVYDAIYRALELEQAS